MPLPSAYRSIAPPLLAAWLAAGVACADTLTPRTLLDVSGDVPGMRLGSRVTAIGDFNSDGFADYAIAAPLWGPVTADSTGRVLIYFGAPSPHPQPDLVLTGEGPGQLFGSTVAALGDVNGDGHDDLLVTAPGYSYATTAEGTGRIFVYFGGEPPDTSADLAMDPPMIPFGKGVLGFGTGATGLGDVDGDGLADWAVGWDKTPGSVSSPSGGVGIYLGGRTSAARPANNFLLNVISRIVLRGIGDFNGDGRPDLAVGFTADLSFTSNVRVYENLLNTPVVTQQAANSTVTGLGTSLVPVGDQNHDGFADFLAGGPTPNGTGIVKLIFGGPTGSSVPIDLAPAGAVRDSFGTSISVGSVLGDGSLQVAVGAPGDDTAGKNAGAVTLYTLANGHWSAPLAVLRGRETESFGSAVELVGDTDGNGESELVVGAPSASSGVSRGGRASLLSFSPHTLLAPQGPLETSAGGITEFHWSGAALADLFLSTDDGAHWGLAAHAVGGSADNRFTVAVPDVITGRALGRITDVDQVAPGIHRDDSDFSFSIVRRIFHAPTAACIESLPLAPGSSGRVGMTLSGGFDVDGDGTPDLAVGAPAADANGPNSGRVWLDHGGPGGPRQVAIDGLNAGDGFGSSISIAGDVTGDGQADLLVGAPHYRSAAGAGAGRASLYAHENAAGSIWQVDGESALEGFGSSVAILGDWDGNGSCDFAVAAPFAPAASGAGGGRVAIYSGGAQPAAAPILRLVPSSDVVDFGSAIAVLDFNGDGAPDLAVAGRAAGGAVGRVFVYYGGPAADARPDVVLSAPDPLDGFGTALAGGDLNGDGIDDLLVGAPLAVGARGATGRVYVFGGGPRPANEPLRAVEGAEPGEDFGSALAVVRDVDDEGGVTLLVGAPESGFGRGAVRSFHAQDPGGEWVGEDSNGHLGVAFGLWNDVRRPGRNVAVSAAPFAAREDGDGRVLVLDGPRYVVREPRDHAHWLGGALDDVRWSGAEPADLALSLDGGHAWQTLATAVGGSPENTFSFRAPAATTDSGLVRVTPSNPSVTGEARSSGFFSIAQTASVERFDYSFGEDGIRFDWQTDPGLGDQGWSAYRLYRIDASGSEERVGPDRITANELLVADWRRGETYALRAVDGLGGEHELGRVVIPAGAPGIRAWPSPSDERSDVQLAMFPPIQAGGRTPADFSVRIYDLSGREVRILALGSSPTRVGEVSLSWDRTGSRGVEAGPGVYFVRAEVPSTGWREQRRIVLLR